MNIEEIQFETVEPPNYDKKRRMRAVIIAALVLLGLIYSTIVLAKVSLLFLLPCLIVIAAFSIIQFRISENTVYHVIPNGTLKINSEGFHIYQDTETFIPYDEIKFITYYFDRPLKTSEEEVIARTYIFTIKLFDDSIHEFFVERTSINGKEDIDPTFDEVMEKIRLSNSFFAGRVRYREW